MKTKISKVRSPNAAKVKKYFLLSICGALCVLTILTMVDSISSSAEMAELEKEEEMIVNQKKELNENLVKLNSTTELETKSSELGFSSVTNIVYITKDSSVAQLQ